LDAAPRTTKKVVFDFPILAWAYPPLGAPPPHPLQKTKKKKGGERREGEGGKEQRERPNIGPIIAKCNS
jgi:hypothetical protein